MTSAPTRTLIEDLVEEHENIRGILGVLSRICQRIADGAAPPLAHLEDLLEFLETYVEGIHHAKEEELLFPALAGTGRVDEGGPSCTLFMDYWINWNPVHAVEALSADGRSVSPALRPVTASLLERRDSLGIPIREHLAGQAATLRIRDCIRRYRTTGGLPGEEFLRAARAYESLLHLHIRKENECLFAMAESKLTREKLVELGALARGPADAADRSLGILSELKSRYP